MYKKYLFLCVICLSINANSASFDCAKASTDNEKSICSNTELSDMDSQMSNLYGQALVAAPNKAQYLRGEQRFWLKSLNIVLEGGADRTAYLKSAYLDRIRSLQKILSDKPFVAAAEPYVSIPANTANLCEHPIDYRAIGKLDFGKDAVGVFKKFFDGKSFIHLGGYTDGYEKEETLIADISGDTDVFVSLHARLCPLGKGDQYRYVQDGDIVSIFLNKN